MPEQFEILSLIDTIIEDGELSNDEVVRLALWLADHPSARSEWPGSVLVEPLKAIMEDGTVTKKEMREVGRLLSEIQGRRTKIEAKSVKQSIKGIVQAALESFDLTLPRLPKIPIVASVPSRSKGGAVYEVDLNVPSCSCPDGVVRGNLPLGHLSRCCHHVLAALATVRPSNGWPLWLGGYLKQARPANPDSEWFILAKMPTILICVPTGPWCDVFAPRRTVYDRFGFNRMERRWSYGEAPKNGEAIAEEIVSLLAKWEKTLAGRINLTKMQIAEQAAATVIDAAVRDQIEFLEKLGFSPDGLSAKGVEMLILRVLRPVDYALRATFTNAMSIERTYLRHLQAALAKWEHCPQLPRYGPYATWDVLNASDSDPNRSLTEKEQIEITRLAANALPAGVFLSLKSSGISEYKLKMDEAL